MEENVYFIINEDNLEIEKEKVEVIERTKDSLEEDGKITELVRYDGQIYIRALLDWRKNIDEIQVKKLGQRLPNEKKKKVLAELEEEMGCRVLFEFFVSHLGLIEMSLERAKIEYERGNLSEENYNKGLSKMRKALDEFSTSEQWMRD